MQTSAPPECSPHTTSRHNVKAQGCFSSLGWSRSEQQTRKKDLAGTPEVAYTYHHIRRLHNWGSGPAGVSFNKASLIGSHQEYAVRMLSRCSHYYSGSIQHISQKWLTRTASEHDVGHAALTSGPLLLSSMAKYLLGTSRVDRFFEW